MNLSWGGQALVQKRGQVSDGGDSQNFCRMRGEPPSPPQGKKPTPIDFLSPMDAFFGTYV